MTVAELIKALQECHQDATVYLWVDGDRHEVSMVDNWHDDCAYVDINAEEDPQLRVLQHLAHVMWDEIEDLGENPDALRIAKYAEQSGVVWHLVKKDAGYGVCQITGGVGNLSIVEGENK